MHSRRGTLISLWIGVIFRTLAKTLAMRVVLGENVPELWAICAEINDGLMVEC